MSDPMSTLTKKQQEAVQALCDPTLALMSDEALARRIGVSDRSLRRWRQMPAFQQALHETRQLPENRRTFLDENRHEADRKLWELCMAGNIKALNLYYQLTGALYEARQQPQSDYNGIKIVFENRTPSPDESAPVVEVIGY